MKNVFLIQQQELLERYPTCKFLGQNKIAQDVNLENCKVQDCQIYTKLDLKDLNIKNAVITQKKQNKEKNIFISQKYFNFLINFDKNLFDDIQIAIVCTNAHICQCVKTLFETLHSRVEVVEQDYFLNKKFPRIHADIAFCIDARGEKLWAINQNGQVLNGDEILYLLAWWLDGQNKLAGEVVGTNLTNIGIENKLRALKVLLKRLEKQKFCAETKQKSFVLGATQDGVVAIRWDGEIHGVLLAMRALASIYLENKNIWLRVKENKYVQVLKTAQNVGVVDAAAIKTFIDFYTLKLKNQGRVEIWQTGQDLNIMVECMDKTMAAVIALDIKKKIIKIYKK